MSKKNKIAKPARVDADKTAKPLSRIVGHVPHGEGKCIGPGSVNADEYRDEDGNRIPLDGKRAIAPDSIPDSE